ncbi:neurosecretory protein VGF [Spea bombifrons]|uniref:neurosecretory protein VGF n=1 Tax=Spea bombifrons TaxID=233779 RepID=UPI00234AD323|nr:neurosecretory protein VGF [Spea bombifrons]
MFRTPPFLLILSLNLLHAPFLYTIPLVEEQRHQTIHHTSHRDPAPFSQLEGHQEAPLLSQSQQDKEDIQERTTPQMLSPSASDEGDELFKDISPKALAAVLLQALNQNGEEQATSTVEERKVPEDQQSEKEMQDSLTESVMSRTRSSEKEQESSEDDKMGNEGDLETVKSLLQELETFEPTPNREQQPSEDTLPDNKDLEELKELLGLEEPREEEKRSPQKPVPHTPRKSEGEEEELAGVAQDLLLQYLLNGGENDAEQTEDDDETKEEEEDDYQEGDFMGGQRPLFEDEEEGNKQDKRSKDYDVEEVDPQTIDKLIELSSRLHLPADDVVDIISDVEKRKRRRMKKKKARDDFLGRREKTRTPPQSWPDTPKHVYYPRRRLEQEPTWNKVSQPVWNKVPATKWKKMSQPSWKKVPEPTWNKVKSPTWKKVPEPTWKKVPESKWNKVQDSNWNNGQDSNWNNGQDFNWNSVFEPTPRRYRTRPSSYSNYIRPRAFQTPPRYYYKPPVPQREDYYDEDQDKQEEMENYIERILLTHPEVFQ